MEGPEPSPVQGVAVLRQPPLPGVGGGVREVLPRTGALGAGCGAARSSLAGLRLGLALPQRGVVPAAPPRSDVRTARSCCRQELCFLSYGRQEIFREGGRQR